MEERKVPSQAGIGGRLEPQICKIWEDLGFRNVVLPILGHSQEGSAVTSAPCGILGSPAGAGGFPVLTLDSRPSST